MEVRRGGLPIIAGTGATSDDADVMGCPLCEAMCAAREAIDRMQWDDRARMA